MSDYIPDEESAMHAVYAVSSDDDDLMAEGFATVSAGLGEHDLGLERAHPVERAAQQEDTPEDQREARTVLEQIARVIDLRGLMKPPTFNSKQNDWVDYKFRMEAIFGVMGLGRAMREAVTA